MMKLYETQGSESGLTKIMYFYNCMECFRIKSLQNQKPAITAGGRIFVMNEYEEKMISQRLIKQLYYLAILSTVLIFSNCAILGPQLKEITATNRSSIFQKKKIGLVLPDPNNISFSYKKCTLCDTDKFIEAESKDFLKSYFPERILTNLKEKMVNNLNTEDVCIIPHSEVDGIDGKNIELTTKKLKNKNFQYQLKSNHPLDFIIKIDKLYIGNSQSWTSHLNNGRMITHRTKYVGIDITFSIYNMNNDGKIFDADGSLTRKNYSWSITKKIWDEEIAIASKWLFKEITRDYHKLDLKNN